MYTHYTLVSQIDGALPRLQGKLIATGASADHRPTANYFRLRLINLVLQEPKQPGSHWHSQSVCDWQQQQGG